MEIRNFWKIVVLAICFVLVVIGANAQAKPTVALQGWVEKSADGTGYTVGEFKIQAKALQDSLSDTMQFDRFVGKEVAIDGLRLAEKVIEVTKIKGIDYKPTEKDYPAIIQSGKSSMAFLPKGWIVMREAKGDLNKDGLEDKVQVIKNNDLKFYTIYSPIFELAARGNPQGLANPYNGATFRGYDGNPRILIVLINEGESYRLLLQNNSFIPRPEFPTGENLDGMEVKKGKLTVKFRWTDNHWAYGNSSYAFMMLDSQLILNKHRVLNMGHNGYGDEKSLDFRRKKVKRVTFEAHKKISAEERQLRLEKPVDLKTFTYSQIGEVYGDLFP